MFGLVTKARMDESIKEMLEQVVRAGECTRRAEEQANTLLRAAAKQAGELSAALGEAESLRRQLDGSEAERRMLLDRVLELSGQPGLFHKPAPQPVQAQPSSLPAPPTRVSFDDVHAAAQQALRDKTFNRFKRAN